MEKGWGKREGKLSDKGRGRKRGEIVRGGERGELEGGRIDRGCGRRSTEKRRGEKEGENC